MKIFAKKSDKPEAKCGCEENGKSSESCCGTEVQKAAIKLKSGSSCCGNVDASSMKNAENAKTEGASVKVLGSGCAKCNQLEAATREALAELGMNTEIEHVSDFAKIASYGVMSTPALVVDGKVVSYGKALKKDEVVHILKKVRG